jgi:hypothetical protein
VNTLNRCLIVSAWTKSVSNYGAIDFPLNRIGFARQVWKPLTLRDLTQVAKATTANTRSKTTTHTLNKMLVGLETETTNFPQSSKPVP